jgi:DNA-binding MarR family transcriptional regulator
MYELVKEFFMQYLTVTLILVMIAAGLFGGLINYFLAAGDAAAEGSATGGKKESNTIQKSLSIGVGAAFLVPLFLNMISSNLLELSKQDASKLLVFAGFCLIASISSKAFINTISDRILSEVKTARRDASDAKKEVEKVQPKVEALTAHATKIDPPLEADVTSAGESSPDLSPNEKIVLRVLGDPIYAFRSMFGLARDADIPPEDMVNILSELIKKKLVAKTLDKDEHELFYLTGKGRRVLAQLSEEGQTPSSN